MTIRIAAVEDAAAVQAIYAPIVQGTGISFETEPPSIEEMAARIEQTLATHPWLVFENDSGVVAYAYACAHRKRAAYQWSCEVSVYVDEQARRMGAARQLYERLFETLRHLGFANALAGITLPNVPSVGFHEAMGFQPIGVYKNVGFKNGEWRDVGWWELALQDLGAMPSPPLAFGTNRSAPPK